MSVTIAERRQIENEMFFRKANEKVGQVIDNTDAMLIAEDNNKFVFDDSIAIFFQCECSDEDCTERLPIRWSVYKKIHEDRDTFIVKTNHQVSKIETVVGKEERYYIVHKKKHVPKPKGKPKLHKTHINNHSTK